MSPVPLPSTALRIDEPRGDPLCHDPTIEPRLFVSTLAIGSINPMPPRA